MPEIVDYDLPVAGAFHNCVIVSIRKAFPGHAQKVMHAIWGLGMLSLSKAVVVVDEHVDVHDYEDVFFRVCANVDPKRDVLLTDGPLDQLDHAPVLPFYGGKLGIDATHKRPGGGRAAVAGGDRDDRRGPGARRRAAGRSTGCLRASDRESVQNGRRPRRGGADRGGRCVVDTMQGGAIESAEPIDPEPAREHEPPSERRHDTSHLPAPSLWPIGFAIGVACLLVGLVVSWSPR